MTDKPDVAFRRGKCKKCGGSGELSKYAFSVASAIKRAKQQATICPTCGGSGETYLLGEMVRKRCKRCYGIATELAKDYDGDYSLKIACPKCHGLRFTPSTNGMDYVKAAKALDYSVEFEGNGCRIANDNGEWIGYDTDETAALKLALAQCLEVQMTIPEKLAAIRERLEKRTVECKHDKVLEWDITGAFQDCPDCKGESRTPDPAYSALLEVVRETCRCTPCHCMDLGPEIPCTCPPETEETGCPLYTTRSIEGWPKGALRGAIEENGDGTPIDGTYYRHYQKAVQDQLGKQYSAGLTPYQAKVDRDLASVDALLAALEEK